MPLTIDSIWVFGSLAKGKEHPGDVDFVITHEPLSEAQEAYMFEPDMRGHWSPDTAIKKLFKKQLADVSPELVGKLQEVGDRAHRSGDVFYLIWHKDDRAGTWQRRLQALRTMPEIERLPVLALDNENLRQKVRELTIEVEAAEELVSAHRLSSEWEETKRKKALAHRVPRDTHLP
jgi:hypothetical protein